MDSEQDAPVAANRIKSPAFQFFPRDFISDELQMLLSLQEAGAYIRLLCHCWLSGSLPDDTAALARLCGATPAHMSKMWPAISRCFKARGDGRWIHTRLEKARKAQDEFRRKQKEKADKRWQASGNATALPNSGNAFLADSRLQIVDRSSERKESVPLDVSFRVFVSAYPSNRRKGGLLVEQAYITQAARAGGPDALLAALQNHLASAQWRNPSLIPGMNTWLNEERWRQTLPAEDVATDTKVPVWAR